MATAISVANFQTAMGEVYDAIASSSWASAHSWLARAEAQLHGLELQAAENGTTLTLRSNLEAMEKRLLTLERRSSKFEVHSRWVP